MQASDAAIEWSLLQNQFDSYEKYSLLIKLASILALTATILLDRTGVIIVGILGVLWIQDAIWKTFQSRIETRLLQLEALLANEQSPAKTDSKPYQFNTEYLQNRPGSAAMIMEYMQQAARPTVAFPHIVLLGLITCVLLS